MMGLQSKKKEEEEKKKRPEKGVLRVAHTHTIFQ